MKRKKFTDSFKLKVIGEILNGEISKEEARRKYGLGGKSGILIWMRKFGVSTEREMKDSFAVMKGKSNKKDELLQEEKIKLLEKALQQSELKAEAYSRMIDIAEKELNIKIRKKSSTKQSGK
jgi:transposase